MTDLEANPIPVWTFDVEHEKKHAQWAWDTNQESLAWCLDGLIGEIERLRAGIEQIRDASGSACGKMETCTHKGCSGSIAAHLIALDLLHEPVTGRQP